MNEFAYGVDFGWVSQLESKGIGWVDENKNSIDPYEAVKKMGADSVRLRVFVNPPKSSYWTKLDGSNCMLGFCDKQSVLEAAKRVKANGMRLMIDFHYSDHFADPAYQDIPKDWLNDTLEEMEAHVYEHTVEVLTLLKDNGIFANWVQVGNEINPGLLLPMGSLKDNPKQLVRLLNAGYKGVKAVSTDTLVITHLAEMHEDSHIIPFFDNFFENDGLTDVLGFSFYPYWYHVYGENINFPDNYEFIYDQLVKFRDRYNKPVMITETGEEEQKIDEGYAVLNRCLTATKKAGGLGVFWWEPETGKDALPDGYPLGAALALDDHTIQFTKALTAYRDFK